MSSWVNKYIFFFCLSFTCICTSGSAQVCDSALFVSICYWCEDIPTCDPPIHCSLGSLDNKCTFITGGSGARFYALDCPNTYRSSRHLAFVAGENQAHLRLQVTNCDPNDPDGIIAGVFHYSTGFCDSSGLILLDSDCNCTLEGDSIDLIFPTIPGDTYLLEIGGCNLSDCDVFFEVLEGGAPLSPAYEEPTSLTSHAMHFSTPDSICQGSRDVPFTVMPLLDGSVNSHFVLYIDGDPVEAFYSDTLLTDWDMPEGSYEVCVAGATECDTSGLFCTTVEVARKNIDIDTIVCEDELPFTFLGENYTQTQTFTVSDSFADGCEIDYNVDLTVAPLTDTFVDAWICPGDSYQVGSMNYTDEGSYPPVTLTHPFTGCDSTVHLDLHHIAANIVFGLTNCNNGIYTLPVQVVTAPDSNLVDITYTWHNSSHNVVGTERVLEVSDPGSYYIVVEVTYEGISCTFTSPEYLLEDDIPPAPAFDVFPDTVCAGETAVISVDPPDNASAFDWTLPSGSSQQSGGEGEQITVLFSEAGQKIICVAAFNNCGQGGTACDTVTVLQSSGNTEAGPDSSVCGLSIVMSAVDSGFWSQEAGPGSSVFSDSSDPSALVTVDTPGIYIYAWQTGGGGCDGRDAVQITFLQGPQYDSIAYNCSADQSFYTAEGQIRGPHTPFTLVSGGGSLDSTGYYSSDTIASGMDTAILIVDTMGCELSLALFTDCDCGIEAGVIDTTDIDICAGDTAFISYSDSTERGDSTTVRQHLLMDSSGNVLFRSDTSFFVFDPDTMNYGTPYFGQVVLGVADSTGDVDLSDACTQFTLQVSITWHNYPMADAGADTTVCGQEIILSTANSQANGHWQWQSGPDTPLIYSPQDTSTLVQVDSFGLYSFLRIEDHFGCSDTDTVSITFVPPLTASSIDYSCDSNETTYTAFVQLQGNSPFTVVSGGGSIDGSGLYTSTPLPSGMDTTIVLADGNGCLLTIELNKDCDCQTVVGMIISTGLELCEGDTAFIPYDTSSEVLDSNDVRGFVLRDSTGRILLSNANGIFPFGPPLQAGITYEVTIYVGDSLPDGSVDTTAACTRQSETLSLIWLEQPTANAGEDTLFCDLEGSLNASSATAAGQWRQISGPGTATIEQPLLPATGVEVNAQGNYLFEWTVQNAACEASDTVRLTFSTPMEVENIIYQCDQSNYNATAQISGGIQPYTLLSGGGMISGNEYTSDMISGGSVRQVQIEDANGCRLSFDIQKACACAVSASIEATSTELTCRDSILTLSAENSMPQDSLNFQWWTTNGRIITSDLSSTMIEVDQSGIYVLIVENTQNGCADTTQIEITAAEVLTEIEAQVTHESCAGKEDGELLITPMDGEEPYTFTLSTGAENTSGIFTGLAPGNYAVTITDDNGCQMQRNYVIQKGPSVIVDIGPDREITAGDSVLIRLLQPTDSVANINWQLLAEYTCITPDCKEIIVYPTSNQQLTATVTVLSGCEGADSLLISITEEDIAIYVPNAFTPNADGVNDHFFISAGEEVSHIKLLLVFDRWGEMVFEGRNILPGIEGSGWDGSFRGEKAPPGVYTYFAEIQLQNGETLVVKGDVALLGG